MIDVSHIKGLELFTSHKYRTKRLNDYFARYQKDRLTPLVDDHVKDVLVAQGFSPEEAPRSIYKVEKLFEALSQYAPRNFPYDPSSPELRHGIALARACFCRPATAEKLSILPMTPQTVVDVTSNPSGSAGLTNFGYSKLASAQMALERGIQTVQGVKGPEPCLAFARTQFNDKTRLVWGYPYSMTVVEGVLAKPLYDVFKGGHSPMAFAMSSCALGTKMRVASYHKRWCYSLDYSQFDSNIHKGLIYSAFEILESWFKLDQVEPVTGKTVKDYFNLIRWYFVSGHIVMPDGNIYKGRRHGVPSGSYFTQIIDSIVNVIVAGAISYRFSLNIDKKYLFVLGDDVQFWSDRKMDLDKISEYVVSNFGMKLHGAEKSRIFHKRDTIHFLGRDWTNGVPDLDESEILKRMINPETFRVYSKDKVEREREVRMLIAQYAAVYRSAWSIAFKSIVGVERPYGHGCSSVDVHSYMYGKQRFYPDDHIDPNHMSGLQRFRQKYVYRYQGSDIPNTAMQYFM